MRLESLLQPQCSREEAPWNWDSRPSPSWSVARAAGSAGPSPSGWSPRAPARLLVARNAEPLRDLARELGERADACAADLSDMAGVDEVAEAAARLGELDGVLVNAG